MILPNVGCFAANPAKIIPLAPYRQRRAFQRAAERLLPAVESLARDAAESVELAEARLVAAPSVFARDAETLLQAAQVAGGDTFLNLATIAGRLRFAATTGELRLPFAERHAMADALAQAVEDLRRIAGGG